MITSEGEQRGHSGLHTRFQMVAWIRVMILGMGNKELVVDIRDIIDRSH